MLYLVSLATGYHPLVADLHRRLRAAGNPAQVAPTARLRKLLTILNAVVRRGTPGVPATDQARLQAA